MSALVVVVIVALGESSEVPAQELVRSLTEASPPGTSVVLREDAATDDDSVVRVASSSHADAVAIVSWSAQGKARLRVYTARPARFRSRDLPFSTDDAPRERGRATGFVVASMVTTASDDTSEMAQEPPLAATASEHVTSPSPPTPEQAPADSAERTSFALEACFGTAVGADAAATSLGGDGGLRFRVARPVELRLGAGAYADTMAGDVSSIYARVRVGAAWTFARTRGMRPLAFSARGDGMAILHSATRNGVSGSRWLPGIGAAVAVAWEVEGHVAPFLQVGSEVALGDTDVFAGDDRRTTIPFFRLVLGLGVDVRF